MQHQPLRSYIALAIAAVIILILSFIYRDTLADIHVHDTYLVFNFSVAFLIIAITLLTLFALYFITRKAALPKYLVQTHVTFTLVGAALLTWFLFQASKAYIPGFADWQFFERNNSLIQIDLLFFLLTQLFFIGIIIVKLIKNSRR